LTVRIEGLRELKANLNKLSREVRVKVQREATKEAAVELIADISNHINGDTPSGRVRGAQSGGTGETSGIGPADPNSGSRRSAPGQYPHTEHGGLVGKLTTRARGFGTSVVSGVSYAVPLEFKDPAKGGRPYMSRGLQENENKIRRRVVEALKGILRRPQA